jgi:hypothetical protein
VQEGEMEPTGLETPSRAGRNRNLWIAFAVLVVLACVCLVAGLILAGGSLFIWNREVGVPGLRHEETEERIMEVRPGTRLQIDNFAGAIDVEVGPDGQFQIVAVKSGPPAADLTQIQVEIEEGEGAVVVRTRRPVGRTNLSVRLEIRAPAETGLDLRTGSGSVEVQGFGAGVSVETGSGSITARGLVGNVGCER